MVDKPKPDSFSDNEPEPTQYLRMQRESTQTIDLGNLFTKDVTSSGSFDVRGDIWASTFGKLLQSLPIPALLVDRHHKVIGQAIRRSLPDCLSGCKGVRGFERSVRQKEAQGRTGHVTDWQRRYVGAAHIALYTNNRCSLGAGACGRPHSRAKAAFTQ